MTPTPTKGLMGKQEWLDRYAAHIVKVAGVTAEHAAKCAKAEPYEVLSEMFADDPEGAADEEMSYWEP